MKFFTKEVQIALVTIVAVVVLFFGMQFLKGLTMFSAGNKYIVKFNDVTGLSSASPVYANGVKVGTVESIDYDYTRPDNIIAVVGLDEQMQVPEGTVAEIASDLLGNVRLVLKLGDFGGHRIAVGDTIYGQQQMGLMSKASAMVPQIEQMLPKLDSILSHVNALLADPALAGSLHNVEQITSKLTVTTDELHRLSAELNRQVPGMMTKADGVLDHTNTLTKNLSDIDVAGMMSKVDQTLKNVEQMSAQLNSKEGSLGLLMRDPELYNNLNATMMHADSLMIDLKSHPKRYVHFSVFGKKDR